LWSFQQDRWDSATLCVMDRLAAFVPWKDRQCWGQATWVARNHPVDWANLMQWARTEGMAESEWERFESTAQRQG
jgi:hypothetical protein